MTVKINQGNKIPGVLVLLTEYERLTINVWRAVNPRSHRYKRTIVDSVRQHN